MLLLSLLAQNVFADVVIGSIAQTINHSIYLLELIVIAIVAVALIVLTLSIAKSRRKISDMVFDIRREMNEERTIFAMTVDSIKEKEKQVSYMAHLLQNHLEEGELGKGKKKAISDEVVVEIINDATEPAEQVKGSLVDKSINDNSIHGSERIDPRTVAADGSVKRAHFGPDQYLTDVNLYQYQVYERVLNAVKQADQYLLDILSDLRGEMDLVKTERSKLNDFIVAIQSKIRSNDPQKMNAKDRKIVKKLRYIDKRLMALESNHQDIDKHYKETMLKLRKYTLDLPEDMVEVLDASPA